MTVKVWPTTLLPNVPVIMQLTSGTVHSRSINGTPQATDWGGQIWRIGYSFGPNYPTDKARSVEAFVSSIMRGTPVNLPIMYQTWADLNTGLVLVDGGSQVGNQIVTDGWSVTGLVLKAGQMIGWDIVTAGENRIDMYRTTEDVIAAGGSATIPIEPPITDSPSNNATLRYRKFKSGVAARETLVTAKYIARDVSTNIGNVLGHSSLAFEFESWSRGVVPTQN